MFLCFYKISIFSISYFEYPSLILFAGWAVHLTIDPRARWTFARVSAPSISSAYPRSTHLEINMSSHSVQMLAAAFSSGLTIHVHSGGGPEASVADGEAGVERPTASAQSAPPVESRDAEV